MGALRIVLADLDDAAHAAAVVDLVDAYAREPLARGAPLPDDVRLRLVPGLRAHAGAVVFLAFEGGASLGIAVCFTGFSTFAARPLLNVHDLAVRADHRGRGVGRALLAAVEDHARARGFCKLTLEVQEHNTPARALYAAVGFEGYALDPAGGGALLLQKSL